MKPDSSGSTYTLTDPGWPRPQVKGYPVPWVAPAEDLGQVNEGRRLASIGGSICQVCGGSFAYGEMAYGFTSVGPAIRLAVEPDQYLSGYFGSARVVVVDGAILHHRCARLTATMCPHIRDNPGLIMIEVPANDADPFLDDDKVLRPSYAAGDCKFVAWPTQGGRHAV